MGNIMPSLDTQDSLNGVIKKVKTTNVQHLKEDTQAYDLLLGLVNETVKFASEVASGKTAGAVIAYSSKTLTAGKAAAGASGHKGIVAGAAAMQMLLQSASLISLAGKTNPAVLFGSVGAMFASKVSLALGLVEGDKKAKLIGAFAEIAAATLGGTALVAGSATLGVLGGAALVGCVAQVILASYKINQQWQEPE